MKITVGLTGASGSIYGLRLIEELKNNKIELSVIVSDLGLKVCFYETGVNLNKWLKKIKVKFYDIDNIFAPLASGSFRQDILIIIPCSMGTLGRIAQGLSTNLLERVADVALKERYKLILSPRETPLNQIQIENMLKITKSGAIVAPISIAFYTKPKTLEEAIDFQIGKIMDLIGIEHKLFVRWGSTNNFIDF